MPEEVAHRGDLDDRTRLLGIPADADLDDIEGDVAQLPVDSFSDVDPWAWVEQDSEKSEHVDTSGCSVTAVLVARDAAGWLPETLTGLSRLRRRPTRLIALDAGSSDATLQQLERARTTGLLDAVYTDPAVSGFGAGIASALRQDQHDNQPAADHDWLWLLHDDAVPAPGGGFWLPAQSATFRPTPIPLVGRTSTVCPGAPAEAGSRPSVSAVVTRQAPGRAGSLTVSPLGGLAPKLGGAYG